MSIEQAMRDAAHDAARFAAGNVIGDAIAKAHPDLPVRELRWSAIEMGGRWHVGGSVRTDFDDVKTRWIVASYANALGGTEPKKVERDGEAGFELETTATFEGIGVTVWGVLLDG